MSTFTRLLRPSYQGQIKAAILDWSGTTADAFVLAPARMVQHIFAERGVPISMEEARRPMGARKDVHIAKILQDPAVQRRWVEQKGVASTPEDVQSMFEEFAPAQMECLPEYADLLPGVAEVTQQLQAEGILIGSTTGFTKGMVDVLLATSREQGYVPDSAVGGDEIPGELGSRPAPFMLYENLRRLGVYPIESVVKVDDTITGVHEGLNAGCWSVGVYGWSNYLNIDSWEQWNSMTPEEQEERREASRQVLLDSGAHYVVEDLNYLPEVIEDINERMFNGDSPACNLALQE